MNPKITNAALITILLLLLCAGADSAEKSPALKIYLPRQITIESDIITLGSVCIIRADQQLSEKANDITLAKFSVPGQKITIDRKTILSRLACSDIKPAKVNLIGAEEIIVTQKEHIITAAEIINLAKSVLKNNPEYTSACRFSPLQIPADFIAPADCNDIKLSTSLLPASRPNQAKVEVLMLSDGTEIGKRLVTFLPQYQIHTVVTLKEIKAGTAITQENIKIVKTTSNEPEPAGWTPPYGLVAKRTLPANTVIDSNMAKPQQKEILVNRNQNVIIKIENPSLLITAAGKALERGFAGQFIKVRNIDSNRTIVAKINDDGTVEPLF
jgi:flagella basal body P-ring formation protein FlgA